MKNSISDMSSKKFSPTDTGVMPGHCVNVQADQENSKSTLSIILLSLLFLAAAHFSVKAFFPNPVFWFVGLGGIVGAGVMWIVIKKDDFGFLLAIFVCVHFAFADNQGSLWSYLLCTVFLAKISLQHGPAITLSSVPRTTNLLLIVFLLHQIIGTILNPYSIVSNIQAIVVTLAQVIAFYWCASQRVNESNLKRFLYVWFFVVFWVFVICMNQKFHWLFTTSPLLPHPGEIKDMLQYSTPVGSFSNSELNAEYFCMLFLFLLVIVTHLKELNAIRIKKIFLMIAILISVFVIVMGGSRSAALLAVAGVFYITIINFAIAPSLRNFHRIFILATILPILGALVLQMGGLVSLDQMTEDFKRIDSSKLNMKAIVKGESINRGSLFSAAISRLTKKSWWFGYGYNLPENNRRSLGIDKIKLSGYHSLYLSLPFFYGWLGSVAYVFLLLGTFLRIYISYLRSRKLNHFLVPVALGFSMMLGVFIIDQYKISATRNPTYFVMIWMLLGLTHSVANSLRSINKSQVETL